MKKKSWKQYGLRNITTVALTEDVDPMHDYNFFLVSIICYLII